MSIKPAGLARFIVYVAFTLLGASLQAQWSGTSGTPLTAPNQTVIGGTTPQAAQLTVVSTGAVNPLVLDAAFGAETAYIGFYQYSTAKWFLGSGAYGGHQFGLIDNSNSANARFLVDASGHFGINTNVPAYTLDVNGTARIASDLTIGNMLYVRNASSSTVQSPNVPVGLGLGGLIERSGDGLSASLAVIGGKKVDSTGHTGTGQLYLGNVDEWNSTMIEGGAGKMTFCVRQNGAVNPTAVMTINGSGDLRVQGNIEAKFQDVAEWVPAGGSLAPGTVVVLNRARSNEVMPSAKPYDTAVAGVVSSRPGVLLGEAGDGKAKIATTGRVKVRVDATRHPVAIGDLLVSSAKPGLAMLSEPLDLGGVKLHRPGTIIGKALEPLADGEGEILVLLSLQ
jgi:hypothetical protein